MKDLTIRKKLQEFETPKKVNRNQKYQKMEEILSLLYDSNDPHSIEDLPNYLSITQLINLNVSQIETLKQIIEEHNNEISNNNNLINYVKKSLFSVGKEIYIAKFDNINFINHTIYKAKIIDKGQLRRCPWQDDVEKNGIKYKEDRNQFKIKLDVLIDNTQEGIVVDIISFGREIINPDEHYTGSEIKYPFFIPECFNATYGGKVFESLNDAKKYIEDNRNIMVGQIQNQIDNEQRFIDKYNKELNNIKVSNITIK